MFVPLDCTNTLVQVVRNVFPAAEKLVRCCLPLLGQMCDPASAMTEELSANSRLGLASENRALFLGQAVCNSTTALGLHEQAAPDRVRSRCTGKERDSESGLDNFGAGYFASTMGRFMAPDWAARPPRCPTRFSTTRSP